MTYLEKSEDFNNLVKDGIHLVDFYADWCGPCKMLGPVLETVSDQIDIIKVNVDNFSDIARDYGIMNIPTLIYFKDGNPVEKTIGFVTKELIEEKIKEVK